MATAATAAGRCGVTLIGNAGCLRLPRETPRPPERGVAAAQRRRAPAASAGRTGGRFRSGADGASATVIRVSGDEEVLGAGRTSSPSSGPPPSPRARRPAPPSRTPRRCAARARRLAAAALSPEHPPAVLRGAPPALRLARTAAGSRTRPSPPTSTGGSP